MLGRSSIILGQPTLEKPEPPSAATATTHTSWWHAYWKRVAVIVIASEDGSGEYLENLRKIYLFAAAAEKGTEYPGSQAGVADMLSSARDAHQWDSSAFWHWNLRMQVAAIYRRRSSRPECPLFQSLSRKSTGDRELDQGAHERAAGSLRTRDHAFQRPGH